MKVREILEAVRSGEITLDFAGHKTSQDQAELLERFDHCVNYANGGNDNQWQSIKKEDATPEAIAKINADMRDYFQRGLDLEIGQEDSLRYVNLGDHWECHCCGEHLHWTLTGNKLQLRNHIIQDKSKLCGIDFANRPVDYVCPWGVPKAIVGEIKIASRLLLGNFFRFEDAPEGKKWSDEYSLNHLAGRNEITQYKASNHNVAYGQMGNMSIAVYVNDAKDSVIIGPSCHPAEYEDYETDAEYKAAVEKPLFPGYTLVGEISLEMWRWEATDLNTIGDKYEEVKERDLVEIDVQHGDWTFQHNFDAIRQTRDGEKDFDYIYARLDLKR